MNRLCRIKSTKKFVSFMSGKGTKGKSVLVENAVNDGYAESDIEEVFTTKTMVQILAEQETPEEKVAKAQEQIIRREMEIITRDQAVAALKTKGKLPPDFVDDKRPSHL